MSAASAEAIHLNYHLDGPAKAPFLILSNSLGTHHGMWASQIDVLTRHFRVLRYDTRGHGHSEAPPGPYTIGELGRDVLALLEALDVDRAHFCGISLGGMTGIWLGIHAPERLSRLVLCNTAARIATAEVWNQRIGQVEAGGMIAIADAVVKRWFTDEFRKRHPQTVKQVKAQLLETSPSGYAGCCAAIRDTDQTANLQHIPVPTLVIAGRRDRVTPPAEAETLTDNIKNVQYAELGAAHLSNIETPEIFNRTLTDFLSREE